MRKEYEEEWCIIFFFIYNFWDGLMLLWSSIAGEVEETA